MIEFEFLPSLTLSKICGAAALASYQILIASAYSKVEPFKQVSNSVTSSCKKVIIVRWQFCDLISGASDLKIYEAAKEHGWRLFYHQDLHAKVYLFDDTVYIGSANLTSRGMAGAPPTGNIEYCVQSLDYKGDIQSWFDILISSSVAVDDELYNAINQDVCAYQNVSDNRIPTRKGFNQNIQDIIARKKLRSSLYLHDLPMTLNPEQLMSSERINDVCVQHDIGCLGLPVLPSLKQIRSSFEISPGFTWLKAAAAQEIYFGELTAKLHDVLCDEPKPYRKEVKECLVNLLTWSQMLFPERVKIDRPRHSQRILII